ncbi:MAG: cyclic nucleotide-binding domain-containing protein, partial [Vicinamibacteria bacterium]
KGGVRITKRADSNSEVELARLSDGDFFGEVALLLDAPREASAVATERSDILGVSRTDLQDLMDSRPTLGLRISLALGRTVAARLQSASGEIVGVEKKRPRG